MCCGGSSDCYGPSSTCMVSQRLQLLKIDLSWHWGTFVHSDVLYVLSLQSQSWRCQCVVCLVVRREFSFSSLVSQTLVFSYSFSFISVCVPPTGVYSQDQPKASKSNLVRKCCRGSSSRGHGGPGGNGTHVVADDSGCKRAGTSGGLS